MSFLGLEPVWALRDSPGCFILKKGERGGERQRGGRDGEERRERWRREVGERGRTFRLQIAWRNFAEASELMETWTLGRVKEVPSPFFAGRNFGDFPKRDSESDLPKEGKWNPKCVSSSSGIIDNKEASLQKSTSRIPSGSTIEE